MSLPRAVVPGRCYMVTRRCSERRFFMRPDAETNNAFLYCLAWAARCTRVEVMFFLAMSNHYHAGVVDREGRLPEFLECFHKLFAKHQNVLRGRWENFWATEQTSVVELVDLEDVVRKLVYALGNPVQAHLVETSAHWPGASSLDAHFSAQEIRVPRPHRFFRPNGPMPDEITLSIRRPPGLETVPDVEYHALLRQQLASVDQRAAAERSERGIQVLGPRGVLRQHWFDGPASMEPRRVLSPRVACKNRWRRIETLARSKMFLAAYRAARERFLAGLEAVFPMGTYWVRRFWRAPCESAAAAIA